MQSDKLLMKAAGFDIQRLQRTGVVKHRAGDHMCHIVPRFHRALDEQKLPGHQCLTEGALCALPHHNVAVTGFIFQGQEQTPDAVPGRFLQVTNPAMRTKRPLEMVARSACRWQRLNGY